MKFISLSLFLFLSFLSFAQSPIEYDFSSASVTNIDLSNCSASGASLSASDVSFGAGITGGISGGAFTTTTVDASNASNGLNANDYIEITFTNTGTSDLIISSIIGNYTTSEIVPSTPRVRIRNVTDNNWYAGAGNINSLSKKLTQNGSVTIASGASKVFRFVFFRAPNATTQVGVEDLSFILKCPCNTPIEPFECDKGQLITFQGPSGDPSGFYITESNGDQTLFADFNNSVNDCSPLQGNATINATGYSPIDNYVYGLNGTRLMRIGSNGVVEYHFTNAANSSLPALSTLPAPFNNGDWAYINYSGSFGPNGEYFISLRNKSTTPHSWALVFFDIYDALGNPQMPTLISGYPIQTSCVLGADMAFNPCNGYVYTFGNGNLQQVNPATGLCTSIASNVPSGGAQFFSNDCTYFSLENNNGSGQSELYSVAADCILDGIGPCNSTSLGTGPQLSSNDGASCGFASTVIKSAAVDTTGPGTTVKYTFKFNNTSLSTITGTTLFDDLLAQGFPAGTTISNIQVTGSSFTNASDLSNAVLDIADITQPAAVFGLDPSTYSSGVVTVTMDVNFLAGAADGTYANQASWSSSSGASGFTSRPGVPDVPNTNEPTPITLISSLPLQLDDFNGEVLEGGNQIFIETSLEDNVNTINLWASFDGVSFDLIETFIPANDFGGGEYSYVDTDRYVYYYVEIDNTLTGNDYSHVIVLSTIQDGFSVYPNPVSNSFTITGDIVRNITHVKLYHLNGDLVESYAFDTSSFISIDMSSMSQGVYQLVLIGDHGLYKSEMLVKE